MGVYNLNFNLSWEIDVWGRIRRQIESASAAYDATLSNYDGVLVTLVSEVAQTYLLIRTTEQRLAFARKNVTYQEESVRISQAKFDAGDISALDVEQGQTLLYNTKSSVVLLEQSLRQFKIALAILLGRLPEDLTERLSKPGSIPVVSPVLAVGMPQDLIRRRPDIRTAERTAGGTICSDRRRRRRPLSGILFGGFYRPVRFPGVRPTVRGSLRLGEYRIQFWGICALEHFQLWKNREQYSAPGR